MTYLSPFNKLILQGEGSIGSFNPNPSIPMDKTILAMWECKTCKHLYIDPVANSNSLPNPPARDCTVGNDETTTTTASCEYERLANFGSIDLTIDQPCSAPVWEVLRKREYWNCRCDCGCGVKGEEEVANKEENGGVVWSVVLVGSFLVLWGGLVVTASVL